MQFIIFFPEAFRRTRVENTPVWLANHALKAGPALRNTDYGSEFFRAVIDEANSKNFAKIFMNTANVIKDI